MFKGKNILVAGGNGFLGANLIKRLLQQKCSIKATFHKRKPVIVDKRIEYVRCDLTNMDDCKKLVKDMDYVFMCAANTSGAAVMASRPLVHVTENVIMNAQMLEAAYMTKVKKFIWISSSAAYPVSGERKIEEKEMFDGDPYDAYFAVGWMKRYTEILCKLYSQKLKNPIKTVVVRPSNIYGPYDKFDFATSHMMAATIRKVIERHNPITVWGNGEDVRDLIYIDDFIDGLILAVEKIDTYEPINLGFGKGYSVKNILETALKIDRYEDAKIIYDTSKPSMIPIRLIDTTKARKLLGFKAKIDINDGIEKTIKWYKQNKGCR